MTLPEKFKFKLRNSKALMYTASYIDGRYTVAWEAHEDTFAGETSYSVEATTRHVNNGFWVIQTETTASALPEKFEFKVGSSPLVYTAKLHPGTTEYSVTWDKSYGYESGEVSYNASNMAGYMKRGDWVIQAKPCPEIVAVGVVEEEVVEAAEKVEEPLASIADAALDLMVLINETSVAMRKLTERERATLRLTRYIINRTIAADGNK